LEILLCEAELLSAILWCRNVQIHVLAYISIIYGQKQIHANTALVFRGIENSEDTCSIAET